MKGMHRINFLKFITTKFKKKKTDVNEIVPTRHFRIEEI